MIRSCTRVAWLALMGLLFTCGGRGNPTTLAADNGDSPNRASSALAAQGKDLADLERQIAAKQKELADLAAKADTLRAKLASGKTSGSNEIASLPDLLAQLPKDRWPKDRADSLKWLQAVEWFKDNLAGKRATWTCVCKRVSFTAGKDGKYDAVVHGVSPKLNLYDREWSWSLISPNFGGRGGQREPDVELTLSGLSKPVAEKLRLAPASKSTDLTFRIESVDERLNVRVEQVAIKGVTP